MKDKAFELFLRDLAKDSPAPWKWDMVHDGSEDYMASDPIIYDANESPVLDLKTWEVGIVDRMGLAEMIVESFNAIIVPKTQGLLGWEALSVMVEEGKTVRRSWWPENAYVRLNLTGDSLVCVSENYGCSGDWDTECSLATDWEIVEGEQPSDHVTR